MKRRKRRFLVVLIPLFLIIVVAGISLGIPLYKKYSYGKEMADLDAHYGVSGEMSAIILQNTQIAEQALIRGDRCYFDLSTVETYLTSGFFYDPAYNGGTLMYTTARETY